VTEIAKESVLSAHPGIKLQLKRRLQMVIIFLMEAQKSRIKPVMLH
jgi:hypothetical protein